MKPEYDEIVMPQQEYYDMMDRTYYDGLKTGAFVAVAACLFVSWVAYLIF